MNELVPKSVILKPALAVSQSETAFSMVAVPKSDILELPRIYEIISS
jgi:hypothetical protein